MNWTDVLIHLLPEGKLWEPDPNGDYYKLLEGIGESLSDIYSAIDTLAYQRETHKTDLLRDLEKEYGQVYNTGLTETQRRDILTLIKYTGKTYNSHATLQTLLQTAGFTTAKVYPNYYITNTTLTNTTLDPQTVLDAYPSTSELLVNGPIYTDQRPDYTMCSGSSTAYCGEAKALAGFFLAMERTERTYDVGDVQQNWKNVFFVCASKSGSTFTALDVPLAQKMFLKQLILTKPLNTWCILVANYTE